MQNARVAYEHFNVPSFKVRLTLRITYTILPKMFLRTSFEDVCVLNFLSFGLKINETYMLELKTNLF